MPPDADVFSGSVVVTASQQQWPGDRGRCWVTSDVIVCRLRRFEWRHSRSDGPVHVTRYRVFPFLARTVFWMTHGADRHGFVPFWTNRALLESLTKHGWPIEERTLSWVSWIPAIKRRSGKVKGAGDVH
jgi:hypothetical protein